MSATLAAPRAGLFRRLLENPGAAAGLAVMAVLVVLALAAPVVAPHGPAANTSWRPRSSRRRSPSAPIASGGIS